MQRSDGRHAGVRVREGRKGGGGERVARVEPLVERRGPWHTEHSINYDHSMYGRFALRLRLAVSVDRSVRMFAGADVKGRTVSEI